MSDTRRAIVFMAWGETFIKEAANCIRESILPDYPIYMLTDNSSPTDSLPESVTVIRREFKYTGKLAKVGLYESLPKDIGTVLFLDVDTRVIADVTLGYTQAERHGMAMAFAPHYSLEHFRNFGTVMDRVGLPRLGQGLYNSGVMFFDTRHPKIEEIFNLARSIADDDEVAPWGDQTYITLAIEMLGFNPYTLSSSFNHRGFGELVSGSVKIWHSYKKVPDNAADLEYGFLHKIENGEFIRARKVPK